MAFDAVSAEKIKGSARELSREQAAATAMVAEAQQRGLELTGPNGLLKPFTKNVPETALNEEMPEHFGHKRYGADAGREPMNVSDGIRSETVISDALGEVRIEGSSRSGKRVRVADCEEASTAASVASETISRVTDKVVAELQEWASRPLDAMYVATAVFCGSL
jgi:transposase-like protein